MDQCIDQDNGPCAGSVHSYLSRGGTTRSFRCERHQDAYTACMDVLERGIRKLPKRCCDSKEEAT